MLDVLTRQVLMPPYATVREPGLGGCPGTQKGAAAHAGVPERAQNRAGPLQEQPAERHPNADSHSTDSKIC